MTKLLKLLIYICGSSRITEILVFENIFAPLRNWLGLMYVTELDAETGVQNSYVTNTCPPDEPIRYFFAELFTCTACMSVWVGVGLWVLSKLNSTLADTIAEAFAVAWGANRIT